MIGSGKTTAGEERALLVDDAGTLIVSTAAPAAAAMSTRSFDWNSEFGSTVGQQQAQYDALVNGGWPNGTANRLEYLRDQNDIMIQLLFAVINARSNGA